jgi:hypothetical protein
MRKASILPALVVVLGFASETEAQVVDASPNYTIVIGKCVFGIADFRRGEQLLETCIFFGNERPLQVPFTATQGLVGFCVLVVGMLALVTMFTFRWKRMRAT